MEMIECQMAVSSIEVMQQLERNVDRRLWAGMMARAADVMMRSGVDGGQEGLRRWLAD